MARRKTLPESVRAKQALAEHLAALRLELFGERGGPEMARRLGIPVRTWYNYEGGVTVPAEVILKIIELTSVEPAWLLHGKGSKFRHTRPERRDPASPPAMTVGALLRTALQLLEDEGVVGIMEEGSLAQQEDARGSGAAMEAPASEPEIELGTTEVRDPAAASAEAAGRSPSTHAGWLAAQRDNRCIQVIGDAMAPIVADGGAVAYSARDEDPRVLDGSLVVAWLEDQPLVRWFKHSGRYALLHAENPKTVPQQILIDLEKTLDPPRFRRVLWIHTPHTGSRGHQTKG
jgi:hypothetical protein